MVIMILLFGLLWVSQLEAQQTPSQEELSRQVRRLVRQLDSDDVAERLAAEAGLLRLGPKILDLLPDPDQFRGQVRKSLTDVRQKLHLRETKEFISASTVTLNADSITLSDALKKIAKQTDNKLVDFRSNFGQVPDDPELSLNLEKVPFWNAMDQVADQANLKYYPFVEANALGLVQRDAETIKLADLGSTSGAFRVLPSTLRLRRNLRSPEAARCELEFQVLWEPRLHPMLFSINPAWFSAQTDEQNTLAIGLAPTQSQITVQPGEVATTLTVPFQAPSRAAKAITTLDGEVRALVPGKVKQFSFDNLDKAQEVRQRKGEVTVVLEAVRHLNDTLYAVRLRLGFDDAEGALASHRSEWVLNNQVALYDAAGQEQENLGLETTLRTEKEIGIAYYFDMPNGPGKYKFVYSTPVSMAEIPIKFQFKNLKLP